MAKGPKQWNWRKEAPGEVWIFDRRDGIDYEWMAKHTAYYLSSLMRFGAPWDRYTTPKKLLLRTYLVTGKRFTYSQYGQAVTALLEWLMVRGWEVDPTGAEFVRTMEFAKKTLGEEKAAIWRDFRDFAYAAARVSIPSQEVRNAFELGQNAPTVEDYRQTLLRRYDREGWTGDLKGTTLEEMLPK